MYQTRTATQTATTTQAKRLAARIGAELLQIQAHYGNPDAATLNKYIEEAELFLAAGYLKSVRYGFKKNGVVIFEVEYTAQSATGIDDKPGRIPATADVKGGSWFSYLTYSNAFFNQLTSAQREAFESKSPLSRATGESPQAATGLHSSGSKQFSEESLGLYREVRLI